MFLFCRNRQFSTLLDTLKFCLSVCLSIYLTFVFLTLAFLSLAFHTYFGLSVLVPVCLSVCLSLVFLSFDISIFCFSVCLYVCQCFCLSVLHWFYHLSLYLSVFRSNIRSTKAGTLHLTTKVRDLESKKWSEINIIFANYKYLSRLHCTFQMKKACVISLPDEKNKIKNIFLFLKYRFFSVQK